MAELTERSKKYTAFGFLNYLLEFNRMPAGLKIVFQRLIDSVLRGAHSFASSLIDDVIIYSEMFERHIEDLKDVLPTQALQLTSISAGLSRRN